MKKFTLLVPPLAAVVLGLLIVHSGVLPGQEPIEPKPEDPDSTDTDSTAPEKGGCICPLYMYAMHDGYCSFYAEDCANGDYVSLDTSCDAEPTNCPTNSNDCPESCVTDVARLTRATATQKKGMKASQKGVKQPPVYADRRPGKVARVGFKRLNFPVEELTWNPEDTGEPAAKQLSRSIIRFPNTVGARKITAEVFLVAFDPVEAGNGLQGDTQVFGIGRQVILRKGQEPDVEIGSEERVQATAPHCFLVDTGSVIYQVLTHEDTPGPPPEDVP